MTHDDANKLFTLATIEDVQQTLEKLKQKIIKKEVHTHATPPNNDSTNSTANNI